jgi:choline-glycine betaine transporter
MLLQTALAKQQQQQAGQWRHCWSCRSALTCRCLVVSPHLEKLQQTQLAKQQQQQQQQARQLRHCWSCRLAPTCRCLVVSQHLETLQEAQLAEQQQQQQQ